MADLTTFYLEGREVSEEEFTAAIGRQFDDIVPSGSLSAPSPITPQDPVNHPRHYVSANIECIDAIAEALGSDGFQAMCRGNAMKYLWRSGKKGDAKEDLRKAAKYLEFALGAK